MSDGVGEGLLQRELDCHYTVFRPAAIVQHLRDAVGDHRDLQWIRRYRHVEVASRAVRKQGAQFVHVVERFPQLRNQPALLLFSPIACGQCLLELDEIQPQVQLRFRLTPERVERFQLLGGQRPWDAIDDAERAERLTVWRHERRASIEPDPRLADHQRVVAERFVAERVWHDQHVALARLRARKTRRCERSRSYGHADLRT